MKKTLLLLSLFCFLFTGLKAQTYTFSHNMSAYSDLTSPIVLSSPGWDDFSMFAASIPFNFDFYGSIFNTVYIYSDQISFMSDFSQYGIASYVHSGLMDNNTQTSTISFQVNGTAPNRIFVLQIKDAAFWMNSTGTDYTNYQLWLYETTNVIEMHYGPNVVDTSNWSFPGATGPGVAIGINPNQGISLSGPATNPTVHPISIILTVSGAPPDGMVYIFSPSATSVNEQDKNLSFAIFPNPNSGSFNINTEALKDDAELSIYNVVGERIYYNSISGLSSIELATAKGIYIAEIRDGERVMRRNLVIN